MIEYKVWEVGKWSGEYLSAVNDNIESELNDMGKEGWELVAISGSNQRTEKWIFMKKNPTPCPYSQMYMGKGT